MKKQIACLVSAVFFGLSAVFPVFGAGVIPDERQLPRLVDDADLLTDEQEKELESKLDTISETYACDVAVVIEESIGGQNPTAYADDFYDYNGYGQGEDRSGILLLVTMEERKWAISTCGDAIRIFTDAGQDYISERFASYLSDADYEEAFGTFAKLSEEFIIQGQSGEPYDVDNLPKEPMTIFSLLGSIVVGAFIALIVTGVMKGQMKTVRKQAAASGYVKPGSMDVTRSNDVFLYNRVTRVAKPKENSGGGGGSSTHTSSSGTSHGGSSGSF